MPTLAALLATAGSGRAADGVAPLRAAVVCPVVDEAHAERVVITPASDGGLPVPAADVAAHLAAELTARDLDVCLTSLPSAAGVAIVTLSSAGSDAVVVSVDDRLTRKLVRRHVALAGVPGEGRALTVAIVADELLRASWAELRLRAAPPSAQTVPAQIAKVVDADAARAAPAQGELAVHVAGERYGGGVAHAGPDLLLAWALTRRWSVRGGIGYRWAPPIGSVNGDVTSTALGTIIGVPFALVAPERQLGASLLAQLTAARLTVSGRPSPSGRAYTGSATVFGTEVGVELWWRIAARWRLLADVTAGYLWRGAGMQDGDVVVAAAAGVVLAARAGLGVSF